MTTLAASSPRIEWRLRELALLVFPSLVLLSGLLAVSLARDGAVPEGLWHRWLVFSGVLLGVHVWLMWRFPRADQLLLPVAGALTAMGLVMVERLQPELGLRQVWWVAISGAAMVLILTLLPSAGWLRQWKYTAAIVGVALVAVTFALGIDPNQSGARLWLGIGDVHFQPSEALKLLLVVFLAAYLEEKRELVTWAGRRLGLLHLPPVPYLVPMLVMLGLSLAVVVLQGDLGPSLLYFGTFLALLYVATGRASYVLLGAGGFLIAGLLLLQVFDHAQVRVQIWLNPWADPDGTGHQVIQALVAMASGGVMGAGLGYGFPGVIPAAATDFVIAAIGEELGLIATLGTLALYMVLIYRGMAIAVESGDGFSTLLAAGLTAVIGIQALVILGGVLRLVPLTGITLPFISYGGSSLLANFVMLGLLLAISAQPRSSGHA